MWNRIGEILEKHGMDGHLGPCKHGHQIHKWSKHGVTVREFGEGESMEAPFTILDDTVHMDYHGACVSFTSTHERIEMLRKAAAAHGKHLDNGHCANKPVRCEDSHGYKICASREGEIDTSDIIELNRVHAWKDGTCVQVRGSEAQIHELKPEAAAHGWDLHKGDCDRSGMHCQDWRDMRVCMWNKDMNWGGEECVHAVKDGHCLQLYGNAIKDGQVDAALARKLASRGVKLHEGCCKAAGFDDRVWHKHAHGVWVSVWTH